LINGLKPLRLTKFEGYGWIAMSRVVIQLVHCAKRACD
jgi:hypothetical protein